MRNCTNGSSLCRQRGVGLLRSPTPPSLAPLLTSRQRPEPLTDTGYALSLYPTLEEHELLVEESTDTRAFLAWGPGMLVVAFRGTVTRKNIVTDLEVRVCELGWWSRG